MDKTIRKILLWPFSLLYGFGISLRNVLYESELLKAAKFNIPLINVGNLSIGGAGKTPHVEYLVSLLKPYLDIAILSRGYKRKRKGFHIVQHSDTALQSGDEPVMYKRKNPNLSIAVSESRTLGIPLLLQKKPSTRVVLLDDAFQHRSIEAGLNILLTPQYDLFTQDSLMPGGRLREYKTAYLRAQMIVVTKCDPDLSVEEKTTIEEEINPASYQEVFFSKYRYYPAYNIFNANNRISDLTNYNIILISAIASTEYLLDYLEDNSLSINVMKYEDHHLFSNTDMNYLHKVFTNSKPNTIILTTEKDAIRLQEHRNFIRQHQLPVFALPISVEFLFDDKDRFDNKIQSYLLNFKT